MCLFLSFHCYHSQNSLEGAGKLHILFLFFVALMFCISLWSLFGYHLYLTANNKTTLGKSTKITEILCPPPPIFFEVNDCKSMGYQYHLNTSWRAFLKRPENFTDRKAICKTPTRLLCKAGPFICCKRNKN